MYGLELSPFRCRTISCAAQSAASPCRVWDVPLGKDTVGINAPGVGHRAAIASDWNSATRDSVASFEPLMRGDHGTVPSWGAGVTASTDFTPDHGGDRTVGENSSRKRSRYPRRLSFPRKSTFVDVFF